MTVYFLRHAEAEVVATSEFGRRLTSKGIEQADKAGKFCARHGLIPNVVLSSPVLRARQTADAVVKRLDLSEVVEEDWIACGMVATTFITEMASYAKLDTVMLVGHEPDFSATISALIGLPNRSSILIRKSSLTGLDLPELALGCGTLEFSIPVKLM